MAHYKWKKLSKGRSWISSYLTDFKSARWYERKSWTLKFLSSESVYLSLKINAQAFLIQYPEPYLIKFIYDPFKPDSSIFMTQKLNFQLSTIQDYQMSVTLSRHQNVTNNECLISRSILVKTFSVVWGSLL